MVFTKKASEIAQASKKQPRFKRRFGLSRFPVPMALVLSLIIFSCTHTSVSNSSSSTQSANDSGVLKIWWDKGLNQQEDEALQQLVSNWEKQTGNKVKLSFYVNDKLPQKAQRATRAGNQPDIMMSLVGEKVLTPRLAWEGKLADVSDVIEPVKSLYPESILQAVHFYNKTTKKRSYYAVPIHQATIHIFYWRDLLNQVGRSEKDIPKDWDGFWDFWKQVQHDLHSQQKQNIYGLGLPYSTGASDTYNLFEQILEAYDVQILDSEGKLTIDDPQFKQKIINILDWYAKFYQQGYVPSDAIKWLNPDNNRNLLNRKVMMTANATLSIPCSVRQDPDIYYHKLGILKFPNKPNGKPMRYIVTSRQAVLFTESKNQQKAKNFLAYLIQPQIIGNYLKAAGGCTLPVLKSVWKDPFWTDPSDPHISTAAKTLIEGPTRPFYYVQNPAYSMVLDENIWGKALHQIIVDGISPQQAADEAIARLQEIFDQWQ